MPMTRTTGKKRVDYYNNNRGRNGRWLRATQLRPPVSSTAVNGNDNDNSNTNTNTNNYANTNTNTNINANTNDNENK